MQKGKSGVIKLDCPILLPKDSERFIHSLPKECHAHPSPDLDVLKMLAVPTVESSLIQCFYFMEIHIYYKGGLTTDKLKAISLPILVCRPIIGAPIPIPQPMMPPQGGQMMMAPPGMPGVPMMGPPPQDMVAGLPVG